MSTALRHRLRYSRSTKMEMPLALLAKSFACGRGELDVCSSFSVQQKFVFFCLATAFHVFGSCSRFVVLGYDWESHRAVIRQ
ncbi:hypothetical protein BQ8482_180476 [Mesorhizobium delmotii]|uniref:Uncharacterized protein n=1 Tax=Mesorhizobium delmotii TaxID=1631247 RepID=A0A2P9AJE4_9HYPH|nr:hypothetical protein BQ8482_180476 [Mesorhizobium delmotii]